MYVCRHREGSGIITSHHCSKNDTVTDTVPLRASALGEHSMSEWHNMRPGLEACRYARRNFVITPFNNAQAADTKVIAQLIIATIGKGF